jgi:hypothetical protein
MSIFCIDEYTHTSLGQRDNNNIEQGYIRRAVESGKKKEIKIKLMISLRKSLRV